MRDAVRNLQDIGKRVFARLCSSLLVFTRHFDALLFCRSPGQDRNTDSIRGSCRLHVM